MSTTRQPRRLLIVLVIVFTLTSIVFALPAIAEEGAVRPSPALEEGCLVEPETGDGCGESATPIEPDPTVLDPQPTPWERIEVAADGRSLSITFWMGVEECSGLHSVEVTTRDGGADVVLLTGTPPGAEGRICVALAQEYVTTVVLDEPLVGNAD